MNHRPQFNPRASATPKMAAMDSGSLAKGSITEFLLDSRTPGGSAALESSYAEEEARREKDVDRQVAELMKEARMWRVANSAQWVAWGIVQAKVPELATGQEPAAAAPTQDGEEQHSDGVAADDDEEFDYLAYSQDRAFFFWGDVVNLGLVRPEELPEKLRERLKIVPY